MAGPGLIHDIKREGDTSLVLLYNFDVNHDDVKPEHQNYLRDLARRLFQKPKASPFIFLRGTASRTGRAGYNLGLSRQRVERVIGILRNSGVPASQIIGYTWTGEGSSKQPDGVESDWDRAVLICVSPTPAPPPDFRQDPTPPPPPLPSSEVLRAREQILRYIRWHHPPARGGGEPPAEVWRYINWLIGYCFAMQVYLRGPSSNQYQQGTDQQAMQAWLDYAAFRVDATAGGPDGVRQARHVWRDLVSEAAKSELARDLLPEQQSRDFLDPGHPTASQEIVTRLWDYERREEMRLEMNRPPRSYFARP